MVKGDVIMIDYHTIIEGKTAPKQRYSKKDWENYAEIFSSITTPAQMEVYKAATPYLKGKVLDAGSGTGKIAHYLQDNPAISSYTGVDYSKAMVKVGNKVLKTLKRPSFCIQCGKIETINESFDSAVSIQSFYAWEEPLLTLEHIHKILVSKGIFILATVNDKLDLTPLIKETQKVLVGHPNLEIYKQYNLQLAENPQGNFISLDQLIRLTQQAGFHVLEAQQNLFYGGLSFLVLKK